MRVWRPRAVLWLLFLQLPALAPALADSLGGCSLCWEHELRHSGIKPSLQFTRSITISSWTRSRCGDIFKRPLQIQQRLLNGVTFWLWSRIKLCNQTRTSSLIETQIQEPEKTNNSELTFVLFLMQLIWQAVRETLSLAAAYVLNPVGGKISKLTPHWSFQLPWN